VKDFTINSSFDDDNGLVLQDAFGDIDGNPVLTFTENTFEPNGDGTTAALIVLP
jgi:hypothetical protein